MFGVIIETIIKSFIDGIVLRTNNGAGLRNNDLVGDICLTGVCLVFYLE